MLKHKWRVLLLLLCLSFSLTGCKKNENLEAYKESLFAFYNAVSEKGDEMDMIDPESETAVAELLEKLNDMKQLFAEFAALTVPKEFENIEHLAEEADQYMTEAVSLYQTAYEAEIFDSYSADAAKENYDRAMKRLEYIAAVLRGEIPDDANIEIVTDEDDEFSE